MVKETMRLTMETAETSATDRRPDMSQVVPQSQ
jgi:hypothetical protein